jgi:hypothetical protein
MAKVVMGKALPVEFATYAATASLAHMAFGKTSADATAAAMGGKGCAAKAAGMAATPKTTAAVAAAAHAATAATAKAPATSTTSASTAASKRIASDPSACQCQRGNESRNLMQTKRLHRRLPFSSICWPSCTPHPDQWEHLGRVGASTDLGSCAGDSLLHLAADPAELPY